MSGSEWTATSISSALVKRASAIPRATASLPSGYPSTPTAILLIDVRAPAALRADVKVAIPMVQASRKWNRGSSAQGASAAAVNY